MKQLHQPSMTDFAALKKDEKKNQPSCSLPNYERPRLICKGCLGELIRGSSWKGVDASGQVDPDNFYPV